MSKKLHTNIKDFMAETIGKNHQYKLDEEAKKIQVTRACFETLKWEVESLEKTDLMLTNSDDDENVYTFGNGLKNETYNLTIVPQVHDRGETKATQRTFKIMGTSFYGPEGKTHTIKVDWNNKLKVYQMWSQVGYKSYHRLEQTSDKNKMWKAYKKACEEAQKNGYKIRKVTEEPENLKELVG